MTALCRTMAHGFTLEQCYTFEQVTEFCRMGTLAEHLIPTDRLFAALPALHLTEQQTALYGNGVKLALSRVEGILPDQEQYRVYGADGCFFRHGADRPEKRRTACGKEYEVERRKRAWKS